MASRLLLAASTGLLTACASVSGQAETPTFLSHRVLIAGDSTAADYPAERAPQIGWGQVIDYYLADDVTVLNRAVNGRSTKSYIDEGKWAALMDEMLPGDLVLISFGHNDSRDDAPERYAAAEGAYRENMVRFASDVKARGGVPVMLSSPARRLWEGPAMVETHGIYRRNAQIAAEEAETDFIDLSQLSLDYFETLGQAETKKDFFWMSVEQLEQHLPGHLERYPQGIEDNTHFKEIGACGVARIVAANLGALYPDLIIEERFGRATGDDAGRPADVYACASRAWE